MASGIIYGTTSDAYTQLKVEWSAKYGKKKQRSWVDCIVKLKRSKSAPNAITFKGNHELRYSIITLRGDREHVISNNDEWVVIAHGAGDFKVTKETEFGIWGDTKYFNVEENGVAKQITYSLSGTGLMDLLDDQAEINSATVSGDGTLSDEFVVEYTPVADTYDRVVCFIETFDGKKLIDIYAAKLGKTGKALQQCKFYIPKETKELVYNGIRDSDKCRFEIRLESYLDDSYSTRAEGDYLHWNYILVEGVKFPIDNTTMPTATLACQPVSELTGDIAKLYWPTQSRIKADLLNAKGKYGADIVSRKITILGQVGEETLTSDIISNTTPITVRGVVTDTRGISRTYEQVIEPVAYGPPQIKPYGENTQVQVARCNASGTLNEEGTAFVIAAKKVYSNVQYEGKPVVFCSLSYRLKQLGKTAYPDTWKVISADDATTDEVRVVIKDKTYEIESTYMVQLKAEDSIGGSIILTYTLPSQQVYMHRSGKQNALALGGYATQSDSFEVYWQSVLHGGLILKSESGDSYFRITVDDDGVLSASPVSEAQTFLLRRGTK